MDRLNGNESMRHPSILISGINTETFPDIGRASTTSDAPTRRSSFAGGVSLPDILRDLTEEKSTTRLSNVLARQMNAQIDVSSSAIGPNTGKQAKLAIYAARRKALLWMEVDRVVPRRRESVYSACRHKAHQWSGDMLGGFVIKCNDRELGSPDLDPSLGKKGGLGASAGRRGSAGQKASGATASRDEPADQQTSLLQPQRPQSPSQHGKLTPLVGNAIPGKPPTSSPSGNAKTPRTKRKSAATIAPITTPVIEWIRPRPQTPVHRLRRELYDMLHEATLFADHNANLTASCIGLADSVQTIQWEKRRLKDLMEKERLISRIFALQREMSQIAIETKLKLAEKTEALAQLDMHRKQKEASDTILIEFFMMLKKFNDRKAESDRQTESRRESSTLGGSNGNGSSMLLFGNKHGKHHVGHRRGPGSHFMGKHHSGLTPSNGDNNERRSSVLLQQSMGVGGHSVNGSLHGSSFMDSGTISNYNMPHSRRESVTKNAVGIGSREQSMASIHNRE